MSKNKIPVGISHCLTGEPVRFDGSHKRNRLVLEELGKQLSFHPLCPEVEIGLGIPRAALRLQQVGTSIECVQSNQSDLIYTEALTKLADWRQQFQQSLCGYIVKKDSPSCGMERVKVYKNGIPEKSGTGVFTQQMMRIDPLLPVEEEGRLIDPKLRENFLQRVKVYYRWKQLLVFGLTANKLMAFHARHKLLMMSRGNYNHLGQLLAQSKQHDLETVADQYIMELMQLLKTIPSRNQHVNVLQHIQGYLKKCLSSEDKLELCKVINRYKHGELPLIAPLTLFDHYFRKFPNDYISRSYYLSAHLN